jgi:two-component system, cell cycle sensor histidine kinase and response regulator CckA
MQINKAIESGALLSRQLVPRGRNDLLTRISISVNSLIEQLNDSLARLLADRVELHLDLGSTVGSVMLYPGQLQQVVMNLVVNAYEAMPNGGCLTIKTAACDLDESPCRSPSRNPATSLHPD